MTDSMKFGPEWLRFNMKSDSSLGGGGPPGQTAPSPIKMADFRYGREEMLALFHRNFTPPDPLKQMSGLFVEKSQQPLALSQMSDDETRLWNRGFNNDKPRQGPGMNVPGGVRGGLGGGRGGLVDRGRGRGRGAYHYSRGLSYEESETPNGFNNRPMRNYDRTQSQTNWGERNGGDPGDYMATSPRKEFGNRGGTDTNSNWRRHRGGGEDDEGWRASRNEKWGRGNNSWRENENNWEQRPRPWEEGGNSNAHPNHPRKPWENEESNLPEWAMENPSESGGSFDASGAFHGGAINSDDEEGNHTNNQRRTEGPRNSRTQPRPTPQTKKEPPNISNGVSSINQSEHGESKQSSSSNSGSSGGPLRQSQSATNLPSEQERRPTTHQLTTSASFSGVVNNQNTSQAINEVKPQAAVQPKPQPQPQREEAVVRSQVRTPPHRTAPPSASFPTSASLPVQTPPKPVEVSVPVASVAPISIVKPDPRPTERPSHDEEIEQRLLDQAGVLVSRLMEEEDREPPRHIPSRTSPPAAPHPLIEWFYQDPQGNVQGPFPSSDMSDWNTAGYFKPSLLVRRSLDESMTPLNEFMRLDPESPFNINYYRVPPVKNAEPALPPMPLLEDTLHLQLQMQQQQRQAAAAALLHRQTLAKLAQSEHFNSLPLDQKQMAQAQIMNEMMLASQHSHTSAPASSVTAILQQLYLQQQQQQQQQQQPPPQQPPPPQLAGNKMTGASGLEPVTQLDPVQQLFQQMNMAQAQPRAPPTPQNTSATEDPRAFEQFLNAFRHRQANPQPPPPHPPQQLQPPPQMESVWGGAPTVPTFPSWANPLVGSTPTSAPAHWAEPVAKGIKTEHEILEEQRRAEDKKKLEELRKQQELQRIKEEEEAERQRRAEEEEELKRKRREEEKERELKRIQEEEEKKKKEAAAAKKAEQDRLRKEEEKKRKEEDKRRKEEEKRKAEEEKRKQEEAKKKAEEEKKKREEMTKKQNEALKRLQEQQQQAQQQQAQVRAVKAAVAPTPAPWITADTSSASLADIQKTERKQQQHMREQQELMKAFQAAHQQEQQQLKITNKSTTGLEQHLKWADNKVQQPARVKSLAEIQAEEQELMSKQAEKEKAERMAAVKDQPVAVTGSIWANQSLTWNTQQQQQPPSVWGGATNAAVSASGRSWDEVINKSNVVTTTKPTKGNTSAASQPQPAAKSQAKSKAKKEEASVLKLFQNKLPENSNSDTIKRWCAKVIPELPEQSQVTVDIATFVDFLLGFETDQEIMGYISYCLGKNSATDHFAREFINRRARLLSNDQSMTNHRSEPPINSAQSNHFQEVKGKNKKVKKNKMTKVDARCLGFNVTAAPDRINVGDRDYVDNV